MVNDVEAPAAAWSTKAGWRPSGAAGGSPGVLSTVERAGSQRLGDANQDGVLDLSDTVYLVLFLFNRSSEVLPCGGETLGAGGNRPLLDVNTDAVVDMSDVVHALLFLFGDGLPPDSLECRPIVGCPDVCGG